MMSRRLRGRWVADETAGMDCMNWQGRGEAEASRTGVRSMARKATVTYTSESAFHALGLPDAEDLVLRADLIRKISEIVAARGLTQTQASDLMHMDQAL